MKLKNAAIISTMIVIIAGFAMISPLFFRWHNLENKQKILLCFTVTDQTNVMEWSRNISSILNENNMGAIVFFKGSIAEQFPQSVNFFSGKVDIGSLTYSNIDLTKIADYSIKLQEVQQGKLAVDNAGNLISKAFQAPHGATDSDIYSLLERSNIMADFSYNSQYNIFHNGQFIKMDVLIYDASEHSPVYFNSITKETPIIIKFENNVPPSAVKQFLSSLQKNNFEFINASQLTGFQLTIRGE